jgi:integrase
MRERGKTWELSAYAGVDATGRRKYLRRSVKGTKRDAERELARLVVEAHDQGSETVGDLLERWFEIAEASWTPWTVVQHRSVIDSYLTPGLGDVPVRSLGVQAIDQFYAGLHRSGGRRGKPLAPATVRRIHAVLRRALQQAVRWGWLATNPAALATLPKSTAAEVVPPSASDVARLLGLAELEDPDLHCYLSLAASTGARRSQMCGLQWRDVDLDGCSILFARGVVDGPDGVVLKDTKNGRAYRVAINGSLLDLVVDHRDRVDKRAAEAGVVVARTAFVFSYEPDGSKPWRPDGVTNRFGRLRRAAGLEYVRLHDLRHYVATALLAAGVPVSTVAGRLGHARASTTLNVYAHFIAATDQHAADVLGQLLDAARDTLPVRADDALDPTRNDG